jgi:hypothetical protein
VLVDQAPGARRAQDYLPAEFVITSERRSSDSGLADDRLRSVNFLLRSLWPGLVLPLLLLLFLFRQLLLFVLFLVLLATLVSHASSFSAIMTRHGE